MALSDKRILEEKKKGNIVISPFKQDNLSTSSYDVTLGEYYFREEYPESGLALYNVWDKKHTNSVWGTKPHKAQKAKDVLKRLNMKKLEGINDNDKVIILSPGETILAHTSEFIGGQNSITTMMKARSSLGRNFIEVCKCAGWGDVGYINRWTMEITNNSSHYAIPLVVGRRIAQIIFIETGPILASDYTNKGKYQSNKNLTQLKKDWRPSDMLPKLYNDKDIRR